MSDFDGISATLARFVELAGRPAWTKRIAHLRRELEASPFRAKLVVDYNWLELIVADQIEPAGNVAAGQGVAPYDLAALHFAQTVVHVHSQLTPKGQRQLDGRLRDSLQSNTGFSSIYLEIDVARRLLDAGHSVEFTDMDGAARYDLRFWKGTTEGEVECKSLSVDAGRKVHRHDFYRFVDAVSADLTTRLGSPVREAIVVTLTGRLPSDDAHQEEIRSATRKALRTPENQPILGSFFSISRTDSAQVLEGTPPKDENELHARFRRAYGDNCHISGAAAHDRYCMLVVRSEVEDDHSAPELEALKKAASQFSGTRPAFIAVQYDDITAADLALPHVRRRSGLLSYSLFMRTGAPHVVGTCYSAYGGLVAGPNGVGVPAFGVPNPKTRFHVAPADYELFLGHIPDEEFIRIVGAAAPSQSISKLQLTEPGPDD